jgi:hypothetical protein
MSRFFVEASEREPIYEFDPSEVISDQPPNVIWIRPRMSIALRSKAQSASLAMAKGGDIEADFSKPQIALAELNILDWEGPDFTDAHGKKIPCTPQNIARLVGSDPFITRVLDEIAKRNVPAKSPDPKSHDSSGSTIDGNTSLVIPESAMTA